MNKDKMTAALYTAWLEASHARQDFWSAHQGSWSEEVGKKYRELAVESDRLWAEYAAAARGRSVAQVEAEICAAIHSARD